MSGTWYRPTEPHTMHHRSGTDSQCCTLCNIITGHRNPPQERDRLYRIHCLPCTQDSTQAPLYCSFCDSMQVCTQCTTGSPYPIVCTPVLLFMLHSLSLVYCPCLLGVLSLIPVLWSRLILSCLSVSKRTYSIFVLKPIDNLFFLW